MYHSTAFLCAKIVSVAAVSALSLQFIAGAVNCRAEEDYWDRFWAETPVAGLGSDSAENGEIIELPIELRLAA